VTGRQRHAYVDLTLDPPRQCKTPCCEVRFARLSPWFAPVRRDGGGGLDFGLVRRALCIFAPCSSPNELLLTAATLFSGELAAAWPLALATEERQHVTPHCLGLRAAFQASLGPISTH
jgi:hypothetical protein